MDDLIRDHLEYLREFVEPTSLEEWLASPDLEQVAPENVESAAFSWGYLQGIADDRNVTLLELADSVL